MVFPEDLLPDSLPHYTSEMLQAGSHPVNGYREIEDLFAKNYYVGNLY
jgi:hypothetical protein